MLLRLFHHWTPRRSQAAVCSCPRPRLAHVRRDLGTLDSRLHWAIIKSSILRVYETLPDLTSGYEADCFLHDSSHSQPVNQTSARAFADAALLTSPLPSKSANSLRAREAGTRAFMMRFSRPGTTLERFLSRLLRPSDTHLLDAHRFHRHGFRIEAEFVDHRCVRKPWPNSLGL